MRYNVIYLKTARQDLKEAKAWYKKQLNGLEKKFATDVVNAITHLQHYPFAYAIRYKNFRIIHTKRFPYSIHFYIDEIKKEVVITAIIHDYRNWDSVIDR